MNGLINTVACASAFFSPMDVTVDLEMDDGRRLSRTRSRDGVGQRSARARLMTKGGLYAPPRTLLYVPR